MPSRTGIGLFNQIPSIITAVFGEAENVTLQRAGEAPVTFRAVFDQREVEIEYPDGDGLVRELRTFIFAPRDVVGESCVGDLITVAGCKYKAIDFLPDGENAVEILLSRVDESGA